MSRTISHILDQYNTLLQALAQCDLEIGIKLDRKTTHPVGGHNGLLHFHTHQALSLLSEEQVFNECPGHTPN